MIDSPEQVERLLARLQAALPHPGSRDARTCGDASDKERGDHMPANCSRHLDQLRGR